MSRASSRTANRRPWAGPARTDGRTASVWLLRLLGGLRAALDRALAFVVEALGLRRQELRRIELALPLAQHVGDRVADDHVGHHDRAFGELEPADHAHVAARREE